jgi:hypothetical protein
MTPPNPNDLCQAALSEILVSLPAKSKKLVPAVSATSSLVGCSATPRSRAERFQEALDWALEEHAGLLARLAK